MELRNPIPEDIPLKTELNVISADRTAGGRIYNEYNEYYSSQEKARRFIEIGIEPILHLLPQEIELADVGCGDGFLTETVIKYLQNQGRLVHATAIDGNTEELKKAQKRGLHTEQGNLEELNYSKVFDLIIMRAVLHYNSYDAQSRIIEKVKQALVPNGIFINQVSSGDLSNVKLRNTLNHLPSLGRTKDYEFPHFITRQEYLNLCRSKKFPTIFLKDAPPNYLTPESMFDRFHPEVQTMSEEEKKQYLPRTIFKKDFLKVVERYRPLSPNSIEDIGDTVRVWWQYPIFLSKKPQAELSNSGKKRRTVPQ